MTHRLRRALVMVWAALMAVLWVAGGQVRGQSGGTGTPGTGTPVGQPTVTATSTLPDAQDLITRMGAAMMAKNTFHAITNLTVEIRSIARAVEVLRGDVSIKPQLEHFVGTVRTTQLNTQPAKSTTQREEIVVVKKKMALKTGTKAWQCGSASGAAPTSQTTGTVVGTPTIRSVDNLGAEAVDAVSVWHVRVVGVLSFRGTSVPVTADYYISQADLTLVRATVSDSTTISGVATSVQTVQDFSKYGEKVRAKLPAACKGKVATSRALAHTPGPRLTVSQLVLAGHLPEQLLEMLGPIPVQVQ